MKQEYKDNANTKAVIYCRVSSAAQLAKGHGNASQETRCREFARMKGYEVVKVFADEAVSGGVIDRPGMRAMLLFLRKSRKKGAHVCLIDDISRIARSIQVHLELRSAIAATGARLESPSIEFGEDSDSILVENLLASVSQHQLQKNAEQTRNRMRARLMNGYWPFIRRIGYKHVLKPGEGHVLVRDEPFASIIQEGLEGFASGRFQMQAEVKRFFESHAAFPKNRKGEVRNQYVTDILTKPIYAGYVEAPKWGVPLRKGRHEGLISFETFEKIQRRLTEDARVPARTDINEDFPLRGAVACGCCGRPLTACWSTSKTGKKHPYYYCFAKGCERKGKMIRRDVIEGDFTTLLTQLTPAPRLFDLAYAMFKNAWNQRMAHARSIAQDRKREIARLEGQIATLLDRIVESSSSTVVSAYEKRIGQLERDKLVLAEKSEKSGRAPGTFEELFKLAFAFLSNPSKLWSLGNFEHRKLVLRLTFTERLAHCPNGGFQTPQMALPFKLLGDPNMGKCEMAGHAGYRWARHLLYSPPD